MRIDFACDTTIFVGSNNSGKTSAMTALRYFLVSPENLEVRDITMSNWPSLDALGKAWKSKVPGKGLTEIDALLPMLDIWLDVPIDEIRHVSHILPTLDWNGGLLGVRLHYCVKDFTKLMAEYKEAREASDKASRHSSTESEQASLNVWPQTLFEFLERRFTSHIALASFILDPDAYKKPSNSVVKPQVLPPNAEPLEKNPIPQLIKINEIAAQRDFADAGGRITRYGEGTLSSASRRHYKKPLAELMSTYYNRHLDPAKIPSEEDYKALEAIQSAERSFNLSLEERFATPFEELDSVGYPGSKNPKLVIRTSLRETDGLKHGTALQHELAKSSDEGSTPLRLPEDYAGLGFQNLIAMTFLLMGFRDHWMRTGKASTEAASATSDKIQPLHLVLIEEPEVHLHPQAQQVFTKQAYGLLRKHESLGKDSQFFTQLIISTHSSHVAYELGFEHLRYFRRDGTSKHSEVPTTMVANLSHVFGGDEETKRFVNRYLKATHCDLFFADAVIFVEGSSERILVPYFIQNHYETLTQCYLSIVDVGGSHAYKFRPLIEVLKIATLVISDLDSIDSQNQKAVLPKINVNQETSNHVLIDWVPGFRSIDELVSLEDSKHESSDTHGYPIYVAYPKAIPQAAENATEDALIPRTFEDAMILQNAEVLKGITGTRDSNKIGSLLNEGYAPSVLLKKLNAPGFYSSKASFALDCLMFENAKALKPPKYIASGLDWLQRVLNADNGDSGPLT